MRQLKIDKLMAISDEGYLYERKEGESRSDFMTTAVWESEAAFENAKKAAVAEFKKQGFNPQETTRTLKIETERGVYERSPY